MSQTEQYTIVLEQAQHPEFAGIIENADLISDGANLSCGDEVKWYLKVKDGIIKDIKHDCRSCAICKVSADLVAKQLYNQPVDLLTHIKSEEIIEQIGIHLSPTRQKCARLPIECLPKFEATKGQEQLRLEETEV